MNKGLLSSIALTLCLFAGCNTPWGKADNRTLQTSSGTSNQPTSTEETVVKQITNRAEFDDIVLKSSKLVVVDFYATWCGPCKIMTPIYKEIAKLFKHRCVFAKLDADNVKEIPGNYGIEGVPSFLFFKEGKEIKEKRIAGTISKDKFEEIINSLSK